MRVMIMFMAWQIEILPHIIAISWGLAGILAGLLFLWREFCPEHWENDE